MPKNPSRDDVPVTPTIPEYLQTTTMRIQIVRVFSCEHCRRMMGRQDVVKRRGEDVKRCPMCGGEVEDKTNSETGQSFIQRVGL